MSQQVSISKSDVVTLSNALTQLGDNPGGSIGFAYSMAKNKIVLKPEIEAIQEASRAPQGYLDFEGARIELCEKYAEKGPDGRPVRTERGYQIEAQRAVFENAIESLRVVHKADIEAYDTWAKGMETFMKEEITITLVKLNLSDFPTGVTPNQLAALWPILNDDDVPEPATVPADTPMQ